jgi:hypothetical protein
LAANTQEAEDDELLEEPKETFKEAKDEPEDVKGELI